MDNDLDNVCDDTMSYSVSICTGGADKNFEPEAKICNKIGDCGPGDICKQTIYTQLSGFITCDRKEDCLSVFNKEDQERLNLNEIIRCNFRYCELPKEIAERVSVNVRKNL